jgi:hypothetical protein
LRRWLFRCLSVSSCQMATLRTPAKTTNKITEEGGGDLQESPPLTHMEESEINKRLELVQQQIQLLLSKEQKEHTEENRVSLQPRTLRLQIKSGKVWGYLTFDLPDGYALKKLESDIEKLIDVGVPIFESAWRPKRKPVSRRAEQ